MNVRTPRLGWRRGPPTMPALALCGGLFLALLILLAARERIIEHGRAMVAQHARVMSGQTEASLASVEVLLAALSAHLQGRDLHAIGEAAGRELLKTHLSGALAQVRNLSIMDGAGRQLFLSSQMIEGEVWVDDRDYFKRLRAGQETSSSGPYVGRNSHLLTYGMARRIDSGDGRMAGLAHAALQPAFFERFCIAVRPDEGMAAALISNNGEVVASCDPGNPFIGRRIAELPQFQPVPFLGNLFPPTSAEVALQNYPLKVVVQLSGKAAATAWRWEFLSSCLSGLLILLATLAFAAVHHYRSRHEWTARQLDLLESKVRERTVQLEMAKQAAERANAAKSVFLAAASHDLRQPFQAMLLLRDALAAQLTRPEERRILAVLTTAMEGGQELLNALLHISTLEAGVVEPQIAPVNLGEVLAGLAAEHAGQAEKRGIRLSFVPSSAIIATDPVLFRRMLGNLLANALKYSERGRVLLGVRHGSRHELTVEVWDSGPGVPAERQAEIWEAFVQLHNPERDRSKGLGLGLAIVAKTAELLDHRVSMRSWPGRGSVFRVTVQTAAPGLTIREWP